MLGDTDRHREIDRWLQTGSCRAMLDRPGRESGWVKALRPGTAGMDKDSTDACAGNAWKAGPTWGMTRPEIPLSNSKLVSLAFPCSARVAAACRGSLR